MRLITCPSSEGALLREFIAIVPIEGALLGTSDHQNAREVPMSLTRRDASQKVLQINSETILFIAAYGIP